MAKRRRKSKARQEAEFFEGVTGLAALGSGLIGYYLTDSWKVGGVTAAIAAVFVIFIYMQKQQAYNKRLEQAGIKEIDQMTGIQFEYYLKTLFTNLGYNARVTQASGDFGADVLLRQGNQLIVVQAKRYKKNVPIDAVQQVHAAAAHYKAAAAWVVSNSDYTAAAYELAKSTKVRLINREQLIELIIKSKQRQKSKTAAPNKTAPKS